MNTLKLLGVGMVGMFIAFMIVIGANKIFQFNKGVTPKSKEVTSNIDKKEKVTLIGTSAIKKLAIKNGSIYFTDGWAIFVPKN